MGVLSNTNESAIVSILQIFLQLHKAYVSKSFARAVIKELHLKLILQFLSLNLSAKFAIVFFLIKISEQYFKSSAYQPRLLVKTSYLEDSHFCTGRVAVCFFVPSPGVQARRLPAARAILPVGRCHTGHDGIHTTCFASRRSSACWPEL